MKFFRVHQVLLGICLGFGGISCNDTSGGGAAAPSDQSGMQKAVIQQFVEHVVLDTYRELTARSKALDAACRILVGSPSETNLQAARQAWRESRVPWEQSEAFLFGPVDSFGYDPALDSWPLDHAGINQAIASFQGSSSSDLGTADPSLKGFHAIEYLLFGEGRKKSLADFTPAEFNYLLALTTDHVTVTSKLVQAWETGIAGQTPFALELKTAGEAGNNLYPAADAAIQEMIEGMSGIADELANNKIAQPFNQANPDLVESQFSYNSLEDFQNNIRSLSFVYLGQRKSVAAASSLSSIVAVRDPNLDQKIKLAIEKAIEALAAIPDPFRNAITDPAARDEIIAAQTAIRSLQSLIDQDLRKLLLP